MRIPVETTIPGAHPDRMGLIAHLFGMQAAPPAKAMILELDCGAGTNIVPLAAMFPTAGVVGVCVDPAERAAAQDFAARVGARNVRIEASTAGLPPGSFDYIICRRLLSSLSACEQNALFSICESMLSANGIAYVAYHVKPGAVKYHSGAGDALNRAVADIMQFSVRGIADASERAERVRSLSQFLGASAIEPAFAQVMRGLDEELARAPVDEIERHWLARQAAPLLFHEACDLAHAHQLRFLGEVDFPSMLASNHVPQTQAGLEALAEGSVEAMEQYLDFVRVRTYRESLFCRRSVELERAVTPDRLHGLHLRANVREIGEKRPRQRTTFVAPGGASLETSSTHLIRLLRLLARKFPATVPVDSALVLSGRSKQEQRDQLADEILWSVSHGVVELCRSPFSLPDGGAMVESWSVAREQAKRASWAPNLLHEPVSLEGRPLHAALLAHLDGRKSMEEVNELLATRVVDGELKIEIDGRLVTELAEAREVLERWSPKVVAQLAHLALLQPSGAAAGERKS